MPVSTAIDIVIVNYRSAGDTLGAVASVCPWRHGRIWVVDNSEDRDEAAALSLALQQYPEARLLVPEANLGFGEGCNQAFSRSSAEFCLFLNPDARITASDIELLAAAMEEDCRWGALSPNIYWDSQRRFLLPTPFPMTPATRLAVALATRRPPLLLRAWARWHLARMRQRTARPRPFAVSFLAGAVLLVRRSAVFAAGGLFDPAFFMFFEDSDLSLRLRKKGYMLGIVPAAKAVHAYRHKAYKLAMMAESEKVYYPKHFPFIYRQTRELAWIDRLGRAMDWSALVSADLGRLHSAEELSRRMGGAGVLAAGISPLLEAVVFRPVGEAPVLLSAEDWERLEPGRYVVVARQAGQETPGAFRMLAFEKI
ncbi:MAG: glycosyltransferase [Pseudomonadota bacterium]